jgi:hypothetical protein
MYVSIRGKKFGFDENGLLFDGTPVGRIPAALGRGKAFYVDSSVAASDGTSPSTAVATIKAAYALCTASQGDTIIVMPGHTETISHATTGLSCTKAGIRIIGLGEGDARPTITLDTANTASIAVSAASNSFENIVFVANFLSIAACFTLSTAKAFSLYGCEFRETSSVLNFLNIVKSTGTANTADRLNAQDNVWKGLGVTSISSFFLSADALDGVTLRRNRVIHNSAVDSSYMLTMTTGACTNLDCGDNVVITKQTACTNGSLLNVGASSTGVVYRNFAGTLLTSGDKLFTTTVGLFPFENRVSGVVGATGFVIPAVDS